MKSDFALGEEKEMFNSQGVSLVARLPSPYLEVRHDYNNCDHDRLICN